MNLKISVITLNGVFFDSDNIPKEIKKALPPPELDVSSVMAKGILAMDTPSLSDSLDKLKDPKILQEEIPVFSQLHVSNFLPNSISDKNEEIKYYFEILPEHQNFVAKIAEKSFILIFDDNNSGSTKSDPRLVFYTTHGGIVRVNGIFEFKNEMKDKKDRVFKYTEVVFTLRDVELKLNEK
jgi:hypothetical protein